MTATQLMQATGKLADDKQWREMFGGGAPGGSQADQAANDRGGWARPTVLPGVTATPGAPAPTAGGQGGYGSAKSNSNVTVFLITARGTGINDNNQVVLREHYGRVM